MNADSISWGSVDSSGCRGGVPTAHGGWKTLGICGREQESGHTTTGQGLPIPLARWGCCDMDLAEMQEKSASGKLSPVLLGELW